MKTLQKDNFAFHVDVEKTKTYYSSSSPCDCYSCRNLRAQIKTLSVKLTDFLAEFGVDICCPDESADVETDGHMDYLFVGYTVTGSMETEGFYETDIDGFHITISRGDTPFDWFPNKQKEPCFFISVTGISLPWVLSEPFDHTESFIEKIKARFQKKNRLP